MTKKQILKRLLLILLLTIVVLFVGIVYWLSSSYKPTEVAISSLVSTESVTYKESNLLTFEPVNNTNEVGIIFYPGGKVDAKAYAPMLKSLASKGYLAVIVTMPLNLAVLNINGANDVIQKYPQVKSWIIMGHSLGGSMAIKYYNQSKPLNIKGIVLLASYPDKADNLSFLDIKVLSMVGSNDKVINKSQLEDTKELLPANSEFIIIEGGNHSQFGYYGFQDGDGVATITLESQQEQTINAIDQFIKIL